MKDIIELSKRRLTYLSELDVLYRKKRELESIVDQIQNVEQKIGYSQSDPVRFLDHERFFEKEQLRITNMLGVPNSHALIHIPRT